jgi:hypothetical protein
MLTLPALPVAMSRWPSPLKSPDVIDPGCVPAGSVAETVRLREAAAMTSRKIGAKVVNGRSMSRREAHSAASPLVTLVPRIQESTLLIR